MSLKVENASEDATIEQGTLEQVVLNDKALQQALKQQQMIMANIRYVYGDVDVILDKLLKVLNSLYDMAIEVARHYDDVSGWEDPQYVAFVSAVNCITVNTPMEKLRELRDVTDWKLAGIPIEIVQPLTKAG